MTTTAQPMIQIDYGNVNLMGRIRNVSATADKPILETTMSNVNLTFVEFSDSSK